MLSPISEGRNEGPCLGKWGVLDMSAPTSKDKNECPCLGKWGVMDINSASSHTESITSLQLKIIWVPVWAFVALPDNTELFLSKPSVLSCAGGLWESYMAIEEEETRIERSRDGGFAERTWGELRVASVLQSPDHKDWHSPLCSSGPATTLTLKTCEQGQTPRGHEASDTISTWLPNQGCQKENEEVKCEGGECCSSLSTSA